MVLGLLTVGRTIHSWFRPTIEACTTWNLPWRYRWRLLLLQPIALITNLIGTVPYLFRRPYTVDWIPVAPNHATRALIFKAAGVGRGRRLRPLHIEAHGGAFIGGIPEEHAAFCDRLARETGAVVVALTYRFAPVHEFPQAIDDVDAAIRYLQEKAADKYGADATLTTVSGGSAGGNLVMAAAQQPNCHAPAETGFKGSVTFYGVMELRLPPWEKPVPENYPTSDPLAVFMPLFDCYGGTARASNMTNPRMSPILASVDTLPEDMLVCVAGIDILAHENTAFYERVRKEFEADPEKYKDRKIELIVDPEGFHGYLGLPDSVVPFEKKNKLFGPGVAFVKEIHKKYGWEWALA